MSQRFHLIFNQLFFEKRGSRDLALVGYTGFGYGSLIKLLVSMGVRERIWGVHYCILISWSTLWVTCKPWEFLCLQLFDGREKVTVCRTQSIGVGALVYSMRRSTYMAHLQCGKRLVFVGDVDNLRVVDIEPVLVRYTMIHKGSFLF